MLEKITVRRISVEEQQMHKDTKWAKQIIALQEDDGKWGCFHSLSKFYGAPLTTEQALRRLERLGYSIEDECISRAVAYMDDCLTGHKAIPDRTEKGNDWDVSQPLCLPHGFAGSHTIIWQPMKLPDSGARYLQLRLKPENIIMKNTCWHITIFLGRNLAEAG